MGVLNFLKKLFFGKKEQISVVRKGQRRRKAHKKKEQYYEKLKQEPQTEQILVEKKQEPSQFEVLLENLEKNRDAIVKAQIVRIPKITIFNDRVELTLNGITFTFCKKGYRLFEGEFKGIRGYGNIFYKYDIIIDKDGYLARQNENTNFTQAFHRWIMEDEVKEFAEAHNCNPTDVHVHHLDLTKTNNRKENLEPMTKEAHKKLHYRLLFTGTDRAFEKWYEEKIL